MKKGWLITAIVVVLLFIGILVALYMYNKNEISNTNMTENTELAHIKNNIEKEDNTIETTAPIQKNKISPKAIITEKVYYKGCDHLIRAVKDVPDMLVNQGEDELKLVYDGWKVENFSSTEIIVYKEENGFCNQHYVIKEHEGVLGIYTIDENGKQTFKEDTGVEIMYLPEEDLRKVKEGIEAVGDAQLHSVLEDFE